MIGRTGDPSLSFGVVGLIGVALCAAPSVRAEEILQTLRCNTEVVISTSRGYHTANKGAVLFDVVTDDATPSAFLFRVHPGLHPSIALKLRECLTASCLGPMTRDSFTLADRKTDGATVRTIDIGRVSGEYTATSETRDAKGALVEVLTERGYCDKAESDQRF